MKCPQCNTDNLPGSVFCEKCGFNLQSVPPTPSQGATCPRCGHVNMAGAIFCDNCGASITGAAPPPPDSGGAPLPHPPITPPTPPPPITPSIPPQPVGDIICPSCNTPNPPGTLFCDKCGKNLSQVDVIPSIKFSFQMENGTVVDGKLGEYIGRGEFGGFMTEEESNWISRNHFKIEHRNDTFFIVDDGSTNGTKLNGEEIKGTGEKGIINGDEILLADFLKLVFKS